MVRPVVAARLAGAPGGLLGSCCTRGLLQLGSGLLSRAQRKLLPAAEQVLEETLHCIPDHVLDAPPRRLEAYQQPIAGLTDAELPPSPWASVVVQTPAAAANEIHFDQKAEEEAVVAVEALQLERTRAVAVMA